MTKTVKTKTEPMTPTKPRAERPHKGLNPLQEELAGLVADMLLNGGVRGDVDLLLTAIDSHQCRKFLSNIDKDASPAKIDESVQKRLANGSVVEDWYRRLAKGWPDGKRAAPASEAKDRLNSVAEIVRANILQRLTEQFEEFLAKTDGVENMWLLNEVLEYANSVGHDIARAFASSVDGDDTYVRVPWGLAKQVKEFVALLEKRAA
jgi:hypothetical protein